MDGEMPEMGEMEEGMLGEPPEMCEEDDEDCEMPEMPEDFDGERPEMGQMREMMTSEGSSEGSWHPAAYLAMGAGSIVLSIVIMYSCFSNFYHKKPGETFNSWQKFVIFCVCSVALATGIAVLCYFIPEWTA